ncbi:NAD(P)/FAD-dependent oxidoreductase [Microvirga rosea]|uniref:NAD(P)/FAD-dependent oxidoreductase n=1 Tax=Microvirga rosea TaxID=2715425 RepID=UPI001D0AE955|nr:NAD(P)/FAD-dependent oxidoreductase [Microvirga rosea]MCB8822428.1 NAD(P)/FAD-dependent oxidoreductase [Microvirga rosea]
MAHSSELSVKADMRPRVVIVGAGFGGLEAAKALRHAPVDLTVIDRHNYHCFQPLLYQVATATLSPSDIAWPIRGILRGQKNTTVFMAEVTGVDTATRVVHAGPRAVPYDDLILATGATHSYFGHDAWAPVAPGLKRIEDATSIRRRILLAFECAELTDDPAERERLLTFVIVGGGPTGVEMAGAIAEVARQTLPPEFRNIDLRGSRIILLEAGPRVLATFPEDLSAYAQRELERLGVEVQTATAVTACDERGVETAKGRVEAGTIIWAAGVVASPAGGWVAADRDRAGRIKVSPDLTIPGHPEIFAIGDTAGPTGDDGRPVPGIAPAAKQMGRYVGTVIAARVMGREVPGPFRYRHQGDLATIGRKVAVVKLRHVHLRGFMGWMFWGIAHVYFLIGLRNRFVVAFTWLWNYFTFQRGARLITEPTPADPRQAPAALRKAPADSPGIPSASLTER